MKRQATTTLTIIWFVAITLVQTVHADVMEKTQLRTTDQQESSAGVEIAGSAMQIDHISDQQCKSNECLVIGMQAYSEPRCVKLGDEGDFCRPEDWVKNATLYYPNKILEAENIFTLFCPCSKGLDCVRATCKKIEDQ